MRLLNTTTIRLEEFNEAICPPYAILSHTWGDEEVSFQEMQLEKHPIWKAGYPKIIETCREALEHHLHYAWIDTCCIDKSSSAELSEAINSMFQWYAKASICFAFLSDIPVGVDPFETMNSRWYTRGWTLQELIAPRIILFYNSDWEMIGSRDDLRYKISASTGIDAHFLRDHIPDIHLELSSASIAQRMSWAAGRQTTRTEDMAYCLLGIFGINMPLLYGEGERAFIRLQEEIIRHTNDHSIFAWDLNSPLRQSGGHTGVDLKGAGVFATTPSAFAGSSAVVSIETGEVSTPFFLTNSGIQIDLRVFKEGNSMQCFWSEIGQRIEVSDAGTMEPDCRKANLPRHYFSSP
ncbi:heterokaryon incompatibility protein-domain-containing protein [Cercophora newfieldiana]|uniref:Heterokaryon incompatibility protein-domain-containing protein n=1 Tax=Cercophora newfieldiana TaxID=92897 RepID=A0AA40CS70_9PEZI|nr:heterokaryon incompatibility protein-domain-containing protein [Cercophora newfieldiana]